MKATRTFIGLVMALALVAAPATFAQAGEQQMPPKEERIGWYHEAQIVDYDFIKDYAVLPKREDVTIIDSRPARKYSAGHVPTAVLMPDSKFEEMAAGVLPEDKNQLLIFYCGGYHCKLSHKSAFKAEAMGYDNIKVYAAGSPDWKAKGAVMSIDTAQLQQMMAGEDPVMIVDSRPKGRKYDAGHVPGALSIPDSQFELYAGMLPADKATNLVFYCGGFICKLSDNSARKAMDLGYTKVKTYQAGFPAWKKEVGMVAMNVAPETAPAAAAAPAMPAAGEGVMPIDEFKAILADRPDDVLIVDVRDVEEYAAGAIPGSINMPVGGLDDTMFELPDDKRIVFVCTSGGRSGEAYDLVQLLRPELNVVFVDAVIKYNKDGTVEITAH